MGTDLVFDKKGEIFAIVTGCDATSEHEWGINPLFSTFTDFKSVKDYAKKSTNPSNFLEKDRKISRNLHAFLFEHNEDRNEAILSVHANFVPSPGWTTRYENELRFPSLSPYDSLGRVKPSSNENPDIVCAWCDKSFAIKVRGDKLIKKLKNFYTDLQQGLVMFGGLFIEGPGIVLCNSRYLRAEHKAAIKKAEEVLVKKIEMARQSQEKTLEEFLVSNKIAGTVYLKESASQPGALIYGVRVFGDSMSPYQGTFEEIQNLLKKKAKA